MHDYKCYFFAAPDYSNQITFLLHAFKYTHGNRRGKKRGNQKAFFEYAAHNMLSAFDGPGYFARQILPEESFFLKANTIQELIDSGFMVMRGERWIIKK